MSFEVGSGTVDVRASGNFCANSANALTYAARDGKGLILVPEWLVGPSLVNGELVEVLPAFRPVPGITPIYAVHAYQRFVPPKVRTFIDYLTSLYGKGHDWSE